MTKKELLVISFGTRFAETREKTIGMIERTLQEHFPDYTVRRAFTSDTLVKRIRECEGIAIDSMEQALERAKADGIEELIIQPTHMMSGHEYHKMLKVIAGYTDVFPRLAVGYPLLHGTADFYKLMQAITEWTAQYDDDKTAVCFMGHGTDAQSNAVYHKMEDMLHESGHRNYFIGTVEGTQTVHDVLKNVQAGTYRKVILQPLMVVAGDHACNDMAGDSPESWKSVLEQAGCQVTCMMRGLGENEAVRELYVYHAREAMHALKE